MSLLHCCIMQQFLVYIFVVLLGTTLSEAKQKIDSKSGPNPSDIESFLTGIFDSVRSDIPDPLTIDFVPNTFPGGITIIRGDLNVSNLEITGLRQLKVKSIKCDPSGTKIIATLFFPSIDMNTNYSTNFDLAGKEFYGNGYASVHVIDGEIQINAELNGLLIENVHVQLSVGSIIFNIHGMLDDEEFSNIFSQSLSNIIPEFINNNQEVVSIIVSPAVEGALNALISFDKIEKFVKHPNEI